MSEKDVGLWLCVGGPKSGQWVNTLDDFAIPHYSGDYECELQVYEPKKIKNPITGQDDIFMVFEDLNEDHYECAIHHALESQK